MSAGVGFEVDSAALNQLLSDATGGHEWDVVAVMVPSRRSDYVVASKETCVRGPESKWMADDGDEDDNAGID